MTLKGNLTAVYTHVYKSIHIYIIVCEFVCVRACVCAVACRWGWFGGWAVRLGGPSSRFIFLLFIFPYKAIICWLAIVKWKTWAWLSEVSSGETLLSRSLLFQLLFWSFRLGFNSPTLLLPGAGARSFFFSCFSQEGPTQTSGHVWKVKSLVLVFVFSWIHVFVFFEHDPRHLPSVASNRGWYGCAFPWVMCIILYKS